MKSGAQKCFFLVTILTIAVVSAAVVVTGQVPAGERFVMPSHVFSSGGGAVETPTNCISFTCIGEPVTGGFSCTCVQQQAVVEQAIVSPDAGDVLLEQAVGYVAPTVGPTAPKLYTYPSYDFGTLGGRATRLPAALGGAEIDLVGWLQVLLLLIADVFLWYIYKAL